MGVVYNFILHYHYCDINRLITNCYPQYMTSEIRMQSFSETSTHSVIGVGMGRSGRRQVQSLKITASDFICDYLKYKSIACKA